MSQLDAENTQLEATETQLDIKTLEQSVDARLKEIVRDPILFVDMLRELQSAKERDGFDNGPHWVAAVNSWVPGFTLLVDLIAAEKKNS